MLGALRAASRRGAARGCQPARRRFEKRLARGLARWGWALAVLLFLAPLWSHWAGQPPSRISAFSSLLGGLPWGDAHGHYEGGMRVLAEGRFGGFSERRPLGAAWLAVRLGLVGDRLPAALMLQAVLSGLCAWLAARAVARRAGLVAALATFGLILSLTRDYLPGVLTEPLGIALACLALVVLASQPARRSLATAALGVLLLGAALQARPGAQFALPLVMLWVVGVHRRVALRASAAVLLAALLTLGHTRALNGLYGAGEASATSYPAFTLYGLSHDTNYERAYQDFGAEIARRGEPAVARELYALSLRRILSDPGDFVSALWRNEQEFLNKLHLNLSRAISPRRLFAPPESAASEAGIREDRWLGGALVIVAGAGFLVTAWRRRRSLEAALWLAAPVGAALSAPFVFGDAGFRGLAVAYPFLAAALGLGSSGTAARFADAAPSLAERRDVRAAGAAVLLLLAATLIGPGLAHALLSHPDARALRGLVPGETAVIDLQAAPKVLVTNRGETHPGVPTLRRLEFERLLVLGNFHDDADLASLRPPVALVSAFDYVAHRQWLLIAPPRLLRESARFLRLRIAPVPGSDFFAVVEEWAPVTDHS